MTSSQTSPHMHTPPLVLFHCEGEHPNQQQLIIGGPHLPCPIMLIPSCLIPLWDWQRTSTAAVNGKTSLTLSMRRPPLVWSHHERENPNQWHLMMGGSHSPLLMRRPPLAPSPSAWRLGRLCDWGSPPRQAWPGQLQGPPTPVWLSLSHSAQMQGGVHLLFKRLP